MYVLCFIEEVTRKKLLKNVNEAKTLDIPVVTEDLIKDLTASTSREDLIESMKKHICSDWGTDVS